MPQYIVEIPCQCKARIEVEARDAEQAIQFAADRIEASHVVSVDAAEPNRAHADLIDDCNHIADAFYSVYGPKPFATNIAALKGFTFETGNALPAMIPDNLSCAGCIPKCECCK